MNYYTPIGGIVNTQLFDTLNDPKSKHPIDLSRRNIEALVSHNGKLYYADSASEIYDTLDDLEGKHPIYQFNINGMHYTFKKIHAMCSLPDDLFKDFWDNGEDIRLT